MEAVAILDALESRVAVLPGGRDKEKHPLIIVQAPVENCSWSKDHLDEVLKYFNSIFSADTRQQGVTVVVDAQRSSWRLVRPCTRQVSVALGSSLATLLVLRPDAFWDKQRVDNCARVHKDGEPVYIPISRLSKYVDVSQLPEELGGTWNYNHDSWIQNRVVSITLSLKLEHFEEFAKGAERVTSELERLRQRLSGGGAGEGVGLSAAEETLYDSADLYTQTREMAAKVLREGEGLRQRLEGEYKGGGMGAVPQDMEDTEERVSRLREIIEGKLELVQDAWFNVQKNIIDAKEVHALEDGVQRVTEWILGPGEVLLNAQQEVGYDITSAEELRREHEALELQCRETYGHYAELLHKIDSLSQNGISLPEDLRSLRDFMDFVCRSYATRLERRRNVLITSARFFRLVTEYFQVTSDVYENLVMCSDMEALDTAHCTLLQLQESQTNIDLVEKELVREGEKLSDLLSMPVKDALGRELDVDYANDIVNVREVLDMTTARRQLFRDSVELQRLTLQQATHVHDYEKDAAQAVDWLNELFQVMLKTHSHVGCNVCEIQLQKDELQAFQETAKGTYEYGCQLVNVALSLRQSCKLPLDGNTALSHELWRAWKRLYTVGQEQMTRLRVSAVFHRSVQQHCKQLGELRTGVAAVTAEEESGQSRSRLRKFLAARERLLLEVGRMVRLGRLLKTRLREPLSPELE
ncbi:S14 domain and spectrin repeat-containing protein 1 [Homalodisca vitripennis]|nr:S14 domain and spectrin repeat-containing protein 1 [Homalodisca vitripennis]